MCRLFAFKTVMRYEYEISQELSELAKKVMSEREDLRLLSSSEARICFLTSTEPKKTKYKRVFADTRIVKGVWTAFCPYDFIITFYVRNSEFLDDIQKQVLMWHELKHCGVDEKGKFYIVPHDIEDFSDLLQQYGLKWAEVVE